MALFSCMAALLTYFQVYWWFGVLSAPYIYAYNLFVRTMYKSVVPVVTPPLTFVYNNRMTVLKYSLYIIVFASTTMWMSTIMFLYIRSSLLLKEHSISPLYFDFKYVYAQ